MNCPDCTSQILRPRERTTHTPEGEPWIEFYWICTTCGAEFTEEELERYANQN